MRGFMKERKENRLFYLLNHTEEIVIVAMFALMVAVIFLQVIMRYVFSNSLSWSEELGKFLFVWITWLGISLGERMGEHIKITMLVDRLPFKVAQVVKSLAGRDRARGLSAGEKKMLASARQIVSSELAFALGIPPEQADALVDTHLHIE